MNKFQKIIISILTLMLTLNILPSYAFAKSVSDIKNEIKEKRNEMKTEKLSIKEDKKELKNSLKGKNAKLINAKVSAIGLNSLTVSENGTINTVNVNANTRIIRHYWGKSAFSEISLGDNLNVMGVWQDDAKTTISARLIRDLSIAKRNAVFVGKVLSIVDGTFVIQTDNRGNQTVLTDSNTKFVNRKQKKISLSDIKVGDRIRVRGMWNKDTNKITEVSEVKNFSIPISPTPTK